MLIPRYHQKDSKGSFVSKDMKKGHFHLESIKTVEVGKVFALPAELNATKVNVFVDVPIDFTNLDTLNGKAKITSNVANIDADIFYSKKIKVKVTSTIPKDSLLINFDKNVKYAAISPLVTHLEMDDKTIKVTMKSSKISADLKMKPLNKTVNGKVQICRSAYNLESKTKWRHCHQE